MLELFHVSYLFVQVLYIKDFSLLCLWQINPIKIIPTKILGSHKFLVFY